MAKPLVIKENISGVLPMEEIRRSVKGVCIDFGLDPLQSFREFNSLETALAGSLGTLFSSDPKQRTGRNVSAVFTYLWLAFDRYSEVHEGYDWSLIYRLSESQMSAAMALFALVLPCTYGMSKEQEAFSAEMVARNLGSASSMLQAQGYRDQVISGGLARIARNPEAVAQADASKAIREEFAKWQDGKARHVDNKAFSVKMSAKHGGILSVGRIQNLCTNWRKDRKSRS